MHKLNWQCSVLPALLTDYSLSHIFKPSEQVFITSFKRNKVETATYVRKEPSVPFILRVLWFFLIGWHVTLYWIVAAWVLNLTIIGMPLGLWMLNRVPLVLTLRSPRGYTVAQVRAGQIVEWRYQRKPQVFFL